MHFVLLWSACTDTAIDSFLNVNEIFINSGRQFFSPPRQHEPKSRSLTLSRCSCYDTSGYCIRKTIICNSVGLLYKLLQTLKAYKDFNIVCMLKNFGLNSLLNQFES